MPVGPDPQTHLDLIVGWLELSELMAPGATTIFGRGTWGGGGQRGGKHRGIIHRLQNRLGGDTQRPTLE